MAITVTATATVAWATATYASTLTTLWASAASIGGVYATVAVAGVTGAVASIGYKVLNRSDNTSPTEENKIKSDDSKKPETNPKKNTDSDLKKLDPKKDTGGGPPPPPPPKKDDWTKFATGTVIGAIVGATATHKYYSGTSKEASSTTTQKMANVYQGQKANNEEAVQNSQMIQDQNRIAREEQVNLVDLRRQIHEREETIARLSGQLQQYSALVQGLRLEIAKLQSRIATLEGGSSR